MHKFNIFAEVERVQTSLFESQISNSQKFGTLFRKKPSNHVTIHDKEMVIFMHKKRSYLRAWPKTKKNVTWEGEKSLNHGQKKVSFGRKRLFLEKKNSFTRRGCQKEKKIQQTRKKSLFSESRCKRGRNSFFLSPGKVKIKEAESWLLKNFTHFFAKKTFLHSSFFQHSLRDLFCSHHPRSLDMQIPASFLLWQIAAAKTYSPLSYVNLAHMYKSHCFTCSDYHNFLFISLPLSPHSL